MKAAAQRVLSHVPMGRRVNGLWGKRALLTVLDSNVTGAGLTAISKLRQHGFDLRGTTALEIGTGWKPVVPYLFRIAGCRRVILSDVDRYLTPQFLRTTAEQLRGVTAQIAECLHTDASTVQDSLPRDTGQDFSTLLHESGFDYRAPYDLRYTDVPDHSLDVVFSITVLEHIREPVLSAILREMHRLLKPSGVMVHLIDHSDHWHYFDRRLSRINFLKFGPGWWRVINSPIAYQNRLRSAECLRLIREARFRILEAEPLMDSELLTTAPSSLHHRFQSYAPEDLATIQTFVVAVPQQSTPAS
jgi:SAM-dependent methyltransferase